MIQDILKELFGDITIAKYIAYFIFILLGVLASVRLSAFTRDKESPNTPVRFSYKFITVDNIYRVVSSMAVAFIVIRFSNQISGKEINDFGAVCIGLAFDQVLFYLAKWQQKIRDNFNK